MGVAPRAAIGKSKIRTSDFLLYRYAVNGAITGSGDMTTTVDYDFIVCEALTSGGVANQFECSAGKIVSENSYTDSNGAVIRKRIFANVPKGSEIKWDGTHTWGVAAAIGLILR